MFSCKDGTMSCHPCPGFAIRATLSSCCSNNTDGKAGARMISPESQFRAAVANLKNLALGKPVTISVADEISHGKLELVTDGNRDNHLGRLGDGPAWVQIDLGEV